MKIEEILERAGKKPKRKRIGRGPGSGSGKTAGRGHKGARSRSGWKNRLAYEGGQMPLVRRMPKRGFSNALFRNRFDIVNLGRLEELFEAGEQVDLAALIAKGAVQQRHGRLKVLAKGNLSKSLTIITDEISEEALRKVEKAGGSVKKLANKQTK